MKNFKNLLFVMVSFTLVLSCSPSDDNQDIDTIPNQYLSINPNSSLLFKVERDDGITVNYHGLKDANGLALKSNMVIVEHPGGEIVYIAIDDRGRPKQAYSTMGSLEFDYSDVTDTRVLATYNEGESRLNFSIKDLIEPPVGGSGLVKSSSKRTINNSEVTSSIRINSFASLERPNKQQETSCGSNSFKVSLEKCGERVTGNASMTLLVSNPINQTLGHYTGTFIGNGSFCYKQSSTPAPDISGDLQKVCSSVDSALGVLCDGVSSITQSGGNLASSTVFCAQLAAISTAAGMPVFAGCSIIIGSVFLYCDTLGASPAPGEQSVLGAICKSNLFKEKTQTEGTITPKIWLNGKYLFNIDRIDISFPTSDFVIDLPAVPAITSMYSEPMDPIGGEDYTVIVNFECVLESTTVTMSVKGSDEYEQVETAIINPGNSSVTISVPGADSGVFDVITVNADGIGQSSIMIVF